MIQLYFVIASALVSFSTGHILIAFLKSKSLGLQTLFDSFLRNILINHQIFVAAYTIVSILIVLVSNFPLILAKTIFLIYIFTAVYDGISLFYVPLIRYISIFNSEMLANYDDDIILQKFRSFGVAASLFLTMVNYSFVQNMNENKIVQNLAGIYAIPTENVSSLSVAVTFVFSLAITGFIILQIKLEQKNFEYSEGLLYAITRNYKKRVHPQIANNISIAVIQLDQLETDQNVTQHDVQTIHKDYSLLFQRIFVILIGIMYLMFFFAENSGKSLISKSVFIQIVVVDLLFISLILESPTIRKSAKQKITSTLCIR